MQHTATSQTLLEGLKNAQNRTVWQEYVERYRPPLVGYFQRLGVQAPDAEDIAQDTLLEFARAFRDGKYDRDRGRLRSWLYGIAHTTLKGWNRRQRQRPPELPVEHEPEVAVDSGQEELWEQEWRDAILRQCLLEVRREVEAKTFEAFELFARAGLPAREVAGRLGLTENAVFCAKRRVLRRVRELLPEIEAIW